VEEAIVYLLIIVSGLAIGSFLNVLIYRIPLNIGFAFGRSFCPSCKNPIKFYDNIPVISYLLLGGRCRSCRERISIRYPIVELLNAMGYLIFYWSYGITTAFFIYSFLVSLLIAIFFIDFDFQIIPDLLTLPAMVLGVAASVLPGGIGIISSLIGLFAGGGALYFVAIMGDKIFKKESMGGGDIKMAAMLGAFLGWQKVIFIFLAAAVIGLVISVIIMIFSKKLRTTRMIPFGPFLAIAAIISIFYGDKIIAYYIQHFIRI
jgi:leader peptidase (prepilin peptidase)/N-methyltransferase